MYTCKTYTVHNYMYTCKTYTVHNYMYTCKTYTVPNYMCTCKMHVGIQLTPGPKKMFKVCKKQKIHVHVYSLFKFKSRGSQQRKNCIIGM